jgi:hypothetical protein
MFWFHWRSSNAIRLLNEYKINIYNFIIKCAHTVVRTIGLVWHLRHMSRSWIWFLQWKMWEFCTNHNLIPTMSWSVVLGPQNSSNQLLCVSEYMLSFQQVHVIKSIGSTNRLETYITHKWSSNWIYTNNHRSKLIWKVDYKEPT